MKHPFHAEFVSVYKISVSHPLCAAFKGYSDAMKKREFKDYEAIKLSQLKTYCTKVKETGKHGQFPPYDLKRISLKKVRPLCQTPTRTLTTQEIHASSFHFCGCCRAAKRKQNNPLFEGRHNHTLRVCPSNHV